MKSRISTNGILIIAALCAALSASPSAISQQKPSLKQLEQQAKERLQADRDRKQLLEDKALFENANAAYLRHDYPAAVRLYRLAASRNNSMAMNKLGELFLDGSVVERNVVEAIRLFRQAASRNNTAAMRNLGDVFANGIGVPENDVEAFGWYKKATTLGDAEAAYKAGALLVREEYNGERGDYDDKMEAATFFLIGMSRGHVAATIQWAFFRLYGIGTNRDAADAISILNKLLQRSDIQAERPFLLYKLGEVYYAGEDFGLTRDFVVATSYWNAIKDGDSTDRNASYARAGLACIEDAKAAHLCAPLRCSIENRADCSAPTGEDQVSSRRLNAKASIVQLPQSEGYYPAASKRAGEQGSTTVKVCVNSRGQIIGNPTVVTSSGFERLDAGAIKTARAGRYQPAKLGGETLNLSCVTFRLSFYIG